jgi:flagellar biosynthesis protein FlgN
MQSAPAERNAFVAGLRAELSGFRELHQILLAEQDCLLRADAQTLPELIEIKSRQIERLHTLAGQRSGYLAAHRLDPSRRGMQAWLASLAATDRPELAALWQEVLDIAAQARALNGSNGGLIGARLNHNQAALAALQSAARSLSTYGPDGHAQMPAGQRALGKA